jgi:hypothetical protein
VCAHEYVSTTFFTVVIRFSFQKCRYSVLYKTALLTPDAAKATESFIMSVVLGHDVVPRLCLASVHALKIRLIEALEQCRYPKVCKIAHQSFAFLCNVYVVGVQGS